MISRILFAAALCTPLAMPLAAQETQTAPAPPQPSGERRYFAPAPPDYRGKSEPRPDKSWEDWVTNADYPLDAWRKREEGRVQYDIAVDAQGKAAGCTITYSTATPTLEAETCRLLLERARFAPAEDASGTPRASVWPGETVWQAREPQFSVPMIVTVAFTVDERGQQRDCRIVERSDKLPPDIERNLERRPCPTSYAARGVPYRDAEGRPVAREVTVRYEITLRPPPEGN
jgi:TonB family protein